MRIARKVCKCCNLDKLIPSMRRICDACADGVKLWRPAFVPTTRGNPLVPEVAIAGVDPDTEQTDYPARPKMEI